MAHRPLPLPLPSRDKAAEDARRRFKAENEARIARLRRENVEMRRAIDARVQRRVEINEAAQAKLKAHRIGINRRAKEKLRELDARFGKGTTIKEAQRDTRSTVAEPIKRTTMAGDEQDRRGLKSARQHHGLIHK